MSPEERTDASGLPTAWTLSASAFNLTAEVVRAERTAPDLAVDLVDREIATSIEVELGQLWRGFPTPSTNDTTEFRERLTAAGGRVSIAGASIDEWDGPTRRRSDDERALFLEPQLRAAAAIGAAGVRLPIGQAGPVLTARILPLLDQLDLVLFEEVQGHQTPQHPDFIRAYEALADLDHPRVRLLLDISMLMPALPETYLGRLAQGGLDETLLARLRHDWSDPATHTAVVDHLRAGRVPRSIHTLYMNLLVRFGRSDVAEIEPFIPLLAGVHLKFWDLEDSAGRISQPIRELGASLRRGRFGGTLCSEWGGLEWLDDDPWDMTARHLAMARTALAAP
jgi:hypothetical protein